MKLVDRKHMNVLQKNNKLRLYIFAEMSKQPYDNRELPTNPNMPVWVLTPKEEQVCFERWRKKTFARCDDLIKAYVACSNSYESPMEAMKKCDGINQAQLNCVKKYQTMEYLDEERDILIADKKLKQKIYRERLAAARAQSPESS